eukprot:1743645-Amphidinium_carterae.2
MRRPPTIVLHDGARRRLLSWLGIGTLCLVVTLPPVNVQAPAPPPMVRVATYNVLNPDLCSKERFPRCSAADVEPSARLALLMDKLQDAMSASWPTVFCLQEVL